MKRTEREVRLARRKVSTTVYLTPEQDAALHRLSDNTSVPVAEYIRRGINIILERYQRESMAGGDRK